VSRAALSSTWGRNQEKLFDEKMEGGQKKRAFKNWSKRMVVALGARRSAVVMNSKKLPLTEREMNSV